MWKRLWEREQRGLLRECWRDRPRDCRRRLGESVGESGEESAEGVGQDGLGDYRRVGEWAVECRKRVDEWRLDVADGVWEDRAWEFR